MDYDILYDTKIRMEKCLLIFQKNVNSMRIGRVSPVLLDGIYVEYYGVKTPLKDLSNITVENANTLKITVFDRKILRMLEKEIFHSNLEFTPLVHDNIIRLIVPPLTEDRRNKICKYIQSDAENSRISIRNIRRDANDTLKKLVKKKIITIDLERVTQHEIQILTDDYINKVNHFFIQKKSEIMHV